MSNILAQPIQQEIPFDTYNKKIDIDTVLCPFCRISLCNNADLRRHRTAMHPRRRAAGSEKFEIKELEEVDEIKEIIDENGGEYLCVMDDDEDLVWRKLPPSHPLIKLYRVERARLLANSNDAPVEIAHDQLVEFMSSPFEDL